MTFRIRAEQNIESLIRWKWPGAQPVILYKGGTWKVDSWDNPAVAQPTRTQIEAELSNYQAVLDASHYKAQRVDEYPELGEQLDKLYHAIDGDSDLQTKFSTFHSAIKAIKTKYPKPS